MRVLLLVLILSLTAVTVPSLEQADTASPGAEGLIAFESQRNGNRDIYVMDADGSGEKRLTTHPGVDGQPVWSPDGTQITFSSDRAGNYDVYVMNADGSNQRRVTNHPGDDASATWSPDGRWLAFDTSRNGETFEIFIINIDGSGERNLTNHPSRDSFPSWSPDGSRIAFESDRDGSLDVYTIRPDGSGLTNLTNRSDFNYVSDWSPDGSRLAFTNSSAEQRDVWVMNADGSAQTRLTTHPDPEVFPAWSADGSKILFTRYSGETSEIYWMNVSGSNQTRLTDNSVFDLFPDSQPITCTIANVIDGDTFECVDGRRVNMLQIDAAELGQCGGDWAKAALSFIFLTPGRNVRLQYDVTLNEGGVDLAAPIWIGNDGQPYNLSIVMVYVGLAKAATVGAGNTRLLPWAQASQNWAQAAQWNMWAPGKTYNGGC